MRFFIAFGVSGTIREKAARIIKELEHSAGRGFKTVHAGNMHVTIEFIGEYDESFQNILKEKLSGIRGGRFQAVFTGIGTFPSGRKDPGIIWIGIHENGEMKKLYDSVHKAVTELNVKTDEREFHPHLTIGRLKSSPSPEFLTNLEKYRGEEFGTLDVGEFSLYRSDSGERGPVYTPIATYQLG
jgi:2'-5' RNA ligase